MTYREILPSEKLQDIILNYWIFEIPESLDRQFPLPHETLPDSCVSLVIIQQPYFRGVRLLGPHFRKFEIPIFPGSYYFGIRILPWILFKPALFTKEEMINQTTTAGEQISGHLDFNLEENSKVRPISPGDVENKLLDLFREIEIEQDEIVKFICLELSKGKSVASVTKELPFSIRVIQKRFKKVVGITMKQYAMNSRQRLLWIDLLKNEKEKQEIIYNNHYYDQSHFINDFKNKMDQTHDHYRSYLKSIDISLT